VLAGDGNDRARLQADASRQRLANVEFVPMQDPGRWEELMQASDVLLVNQRASVADMSLPSKLTSYFAAGRPVVASVSPDSETAREIEAAEAGHIVPPEEPAALRDVLVTLRRDPSAAAAIGASVRRYAQCHLSGEASLERHEQFVRAVASRSVRRGHVEPVAAAAQ
jgi:glycosyltransferase involved in cell wall biosynthesis